MSDWDTDATPGRVAVDATPGRWDATPQAASRWDATPTPGRLDAGEPTPRRNRWDQTPTPGRVRSQASQVSDCPIARACQAQLVPLAEESLLATAPSEVIEPVASSDPNQPLRTRFMGCHSTVKHWREASVYLLVATVRREPQETCHILCWIISCHCMAKYDLQVFTRHLQCILRICWK